jgi:hypothetical protein
MTVIGFGEFSVGYCLSVLEIFDKASRSGLQYATIVHVSPRRQPNFCDLILMSIDFHFGTLEGAVAKYCLFF